MRPPSGRGPVPAGVTRLLGVLVALALVVTAGCSGDDAAEPPATTEAPAVRTGGTLQLALVGDGVPLDPAAVVPTDAAGQMAADLLYGRLTATDPQSGSAGPALASSWEASDDQTRFTFALDPESRFSDGSAVTAADVVATLTRVAARGSASLAASALDGVAGYEDLVAGTTDALAGLEAPDDGTVVITMSEADADLPALLAAPSYGVLPAGQPVAEGPPVTSGPYRVESSDGSTTVLLRADGTEPELAPPDEVDVTWVADAEAAAAAFDDGSADVVPLPAGEASQLVAPGTGVVSLAPSGVVWWLAFNLDDDETAELALRRAVAHGLDRAPLVEAQPGRRALDGVVPPQAAGGTDDACGDGCATDLEAARADLATVAPDGDATVRLDVYDDPELAAVAESVEAQLAEIGLTVETRSRPFEQYRSGALVADRQMWWFGWVGLAPTADAYLAPLFLTGSPDNVTGLADADVDAAIRAARATADPAARAEAWARAQQLVLDRLPVLPVAQGQHATALTPRVQGFAQRLDGTYDVSALWLADG